MRNFKPFRLAIAVVVTGVVSGSALGAPAATPNAKAAEQVLSRERQYSAALLHGDARMLASVLADSFVDTSASGLLHDKQQLLRIIARQRPPTSITETNRKIQVYGDTAVVTVRFAVKGMDAGKPYDFMGRATDVWIDRDGNWYCIAAHSSPMH